MGLASGPNSIGSLLGLSFLNIIICILNIIIFIIIKSINMKNSIICLINIIIIVGINIKNSIICVINIIIFIIIKILLFVL